MKKLMALVFATLAVLSLSGCGGGSTTVIVDDTPDNSNETTLFLVDERGHSYGGVPYICDSMIDWELTKPNGEFTFFPPDDCEFDFTGFEGDYNDNTIVDDVVRIVDISEDGKEGIPYSCEFFGASTTFGDGSFFYDIDDRCIFEL